MALTKFRGRFEKKLTQNNRFAPFLYLAPHNTLIVTYTSKKYIIIREHFDYLFSLDKCYHLVIV